MFWHDTRAYLHTRKSALNRANNACLNRRQETTKNLMRHR